ncbi:MAG: DMT family transporter [Nanoarchaeota archaeon]|nr:DMT family transporter [Nanoarchaeota archaeon]
MGLFYLSFNYIPINRALFIFFTYPIITSILAHIFINEPITKQDIISISISFIGIVAIFWKTSLSGGTLIGDVMVIISVLMWSGYIVLNRYTALREVYYKQTFWIFAFSLIFLLPVFIFTDSFSTFAAASAKTIFLLIFVGFVSTLLPYTILNYASKHMKTSVIGVFILLSMVLTIFLSFAFLGEEPKTNVIIGGIFITIAAITSVYSFDQLFSFRKYVKVRLKHEGWRAAVRILLRR